MEMSQVQPSLRHQERPRGRRDEEEVVYSNIGVRNYLWNRWIYGASYGHRRFIGFMDDKPIPIV